MKVNLFIPGFSKCGTSSLFNLLINHEDIDYGSSKEPAFFSKVKGFNETKDFEDWSVKGNYYRGIKWYKSIFRNSDFNSKYIVEASTIYSFDLDSPKLIYNYNPNSKFIFIVREPYKRIESHYFQEIKNGFKLPRFEEFIVSDHPRLKFYKRITNYKSTIDNYINVFGEQNIYVISLNALKNDPQTVFSDIFTFLNIQNYNITRGLKTEAINTRKQPRNKLLKNILINIERSNIARSSPRVVQELGSKVMRNIDGFLLKETHQKPNITSDFRKSVNNEFKEDLDYLTNKHQIFLQDV